MGLFVKVGTTQELEALAAGKLVEASGQRIAIFNLWEVLGARGHVPPSRRTAVRGQADGG